MIFQWNIMRLGRVAMISPLSVQLRGSKAQALTTAITLSSAVGRTASANWPSSRIITIVNTAIRPQSWLLVRTGASRPFSPGRQENRPSSSALPCRGVPSP
jgi:hypothetical protein